MRVAVIIPAAGSGSRFGSEVPKQFLSLGGKPVIQHVIERFIVFDAARIVVAVPEPLLATVKQDPGDRVRFVAGGSTRQDSVTRALREVPDEFAFVAVHDAVRPFVSREIFDAVVAAAVEHGGALPVLPVTDSIHVVQNGLVTTTLDRAGVVAAQTPQCFRTEIIRELLERAFHDGVIGTDEAGLAVRYGFPVAAVPGDPVNLKITHAEDLAFAEAQLAAWSSE